MYTRGVDNKTTGNTGSGATSLASSRYTVGVAEDVSNTPSDQFAQDGQDAQDGVDGVSGLNGLNGLVIRIEVTDNGIGIDQVGVCI